MTLGGQENIYTADAQYPEALVCTFLFTINSKVYFTDGKTIFSTDVNLENRIDHITGSFLLDVFTDGEYIYYGVPIEDGSHIESIHRVDFDGKNDIELGIIASNGNVKITSKYIYYEKYDEISIGKNKVSGYSGDEIVLYNSEIWRCNHDGTDQKLIYKFKGDMANYRIRNECYIGNYIYGVYNYWVDSNNDGTFEDGDHHSSADNDEYKIMRIDVNTGEIFIINGAY